MTDDTQRKPGPELPYRPPQRPPGKRTTPRRMHYDYSHSSSDQADEHWYSWPGHGNPLAGQDFARPSAAIPSVQKQPPRTPTRPGTHPPSRTRQRVNERRLRRQGAQQNWAWAIIAIAMLGLTLITSLILIVVLRSDNSGGNAFANAQNLIEPTSIIYSNPELGEPGAGEGVGGALEGNSLNIQPWDGEDRLTVLVMGMDNRPGEQRVVCRTDSMMVISLDPVEKTIGILGIPRDTYVEVPNYGLERINTACVLGNLEQAGTGPQLAMQTVQYNFGIRVNEYLMVDFNTFISIIDRIGGVTVEVDHEINDPTYPDMFYGYDPFYISAGTHQLDGETALKYARSRHTSDDIDRQRRQQQIIFAARDRVLQFNMLDNLLTQAPGIWGDLSDGIDTSLSFDQIIQLILFARDIPGENITKGIVSWDYLFSYRTPTGGAVVVPRRASLGELMTTVFGENYNR